MKLKVDTGIGDSRNPNRVACARVVGHLPFIRLSGTMYSVWYGRIEQITIYGFQLQSSTLNLFLAQPTFTVQQASS